MENRKYMFLKLCEKSFVKCTPDSYSYSFFKEGIRNSLQINQSAYDILCCCDGQHNMEDTVLHLCKKYNSDKNTVKNNVENFLNPLIDSKLVEFSSSKSLIGIKKGNIEFCLPDVIIWEITNFCPLDCKHCYLENKNQSMITKKDIDKILKVVDESGVFQVQITGGEALTHPRFGNIVSNLIDRGIIVSVSTSGMILNDNILESLCKLKKVAGSYVRVSLDGNEKMHNFVRNNFASYKNAVKFIQEMVKNGVECQISTIISNQSESEIEELVCFSKKLGVSLVEIGLVINTGNALKNNFVSNMEVSKYSMFLKSLSLKYSDENFTVKLPCDESQKNCGAGSKIITISPNMDVKPCPTNNLVLGNLQEQPIEEIMINSGKNLCGLVAPCDEFCVDCKNKDICKNCISQGLAQKDSVKYCNWYENQKDILSKFLGC